MNDSYDKGKVIDRLISEVRQSSSLISSVRRILDSDERYCDLSLLGGVRAMLSDVHEQENRIWELEKELRRSKKF